MNSFRPLSLIVLTVLFGCEPSSGPEGVAPDSAPADQVFINGHVLTVDEDFSVAEAIAVQGDRILGVGTNEEILALVGPTTQTTDLDGRTVIPGLIDNHMHFVRAARDWYRHVRWDDVTSRAEAFERVGEKASALPAGEWILSIGGWNFAQFLDDDGLFTVAELDEVAPENPLYVQRSYQRGFANSRALQAAGIDETTTARGPGTVVKDEAGNLTGELAGRGAMDLVNRAIPTVPNDVWDESLQQTIVDMHRMGLTTVYDVSGGGMTPDYYDVVRRAADADDLTMRVFHTLNPISASGGIGRSAEDIVEALTSYTPDTSGLRFAQFGWGESTYGPMRVEPFEISRAELDNYRAISLAAAEHGWQMHEHSWQEPKIQAMLGVFEAVDEVHSIADARWTIAHTNGISPASIERANKLGMVFAVHSFSRLSTPAELVAGGRQPPPIRTIHESGAIWGLGSDATVVASPNPFHNIGWAVSGLSPGGAAILEQTVSREAALTAHTRTNAYLLFREDHLGSLESGKLADFAVLNRDYMTVPEEEIKDLYSLMTVVGGEIVYSAL